MKNGTVLRTALLLVVAVALANVSRPDVALAESESRAHWRPIGPFGGSIRSLSVSATKPSQIYAAAIFGPVFASRNSGRTWEAVLEDVRAVSVVIDVSL